MLALAKKVRKKSRDENFAHGKKKAKKNLQAKISGYTICNFVYLSQASLYFLPQIVEVDYVKLPEGLYSSLVGGVINRCLTSDPGQRPDSVELGALIAPVMMQQMDKMATSLETLQAKLDREKQRTIK